MSVTAGEIRIDLAYGCGRVREVKIASTRPSAAKVLIGKMPEQLLFTVPLLFGLCGNAQAFAALSACRAALGLPADPAADRARSMLVRIETLREHAWRILLDWPALTGQSREQHLLASLLTFDRRCKQLLFRGGDAFKLDSRLNEDQGGLGKLIDELAASIDTMLFGGKLDAFRSINYESQLRAWLTQSSAPAASVLQALYDSDWPAAGRCESPMLPELALPALHTILSQQDLAEFCRLPTWQGRCAESTPFSRQQNNPLLADVVHRYGNGLLPRFLAMLTEVAQLLTELTEPSESQADSFGDSNGIGLAHVPAARGLLIHRLVFRSGRVYDYHIVAPTEWNFHPSGVLNRSLRALSAENSESLRIQAEWLIQAIDPCVRYRLAVGEI